MATIIGGGVRKAPRIMSRKSNIMIRKPKDNFNTGRDNEEDKLRNEGFEVHSGVLTVNQAHPAHYKPKPLPGVANEVESYPCRFCPDRIFLTGSWLEKHAKEVHPSHVSEIMSDIISISTEWKKREFEEIRAKERQTLDRIRHEARANMLIRQAMSGGTAASNSGLQELTGDRYEACAICNVLINIAHPTAMESHQRAHKKNDELRMQMIEQYGSEIVQRLTCDSCSLVFTEDRKLQMHITTHHVRKKRYICKFCGHISPSMTELNLHKSDVHNIVLPHRATTDNWSTGQNYMRSGRNQSRYEEEMKKRSLKRRAPSEGTNEQQCLAVIGQISDGDTPCHVHCPECGLQLNRPLLLIKHMQRVHGKMIFSFVVETGGLPSFGCDVQANEIIWTCCSQKFNNRPEFIDHRRLHIPTMNQEEEEEGSSTMIGEEGEEEGGVEEGSGGSEDFEGQLVQAPDGSMQVILPEGMEVNGDVFVMFDPEYDGDKANAKVRLVQTTTTNQMMNEEEGGDGVGEHQNVITITQEQYEELQMNGWNNMDIMLVNEGEVIEEEEVVIGDDVEINGTPLFD